MTSFWRLQYKAHLVVLHPPATHPHDSRPTILPPSKFNDQIKWQRVQHFQASSSVLLLVSSLFSFPSHPRRGIPSTSSTQARGRAVLALVYLVILVPAPALVITFLLPSVATSQCQFFSVSPPHRSSKFSLVLTQEIPSGGRLSSGTIHNLTFTLILHPIGELVPLDKPSRPFP